MHGEKTGKTTFFCHNQQGKGVMNSTQNRFSSPKTPLLSPKTIFSSLFWDGDNKIAYKPHAHPTFAPKKQRHNEKQDLHFWRFDHARRGF